MKKANPPATKALGAKPLSAEQRAGLAQKPTARARQKTKAPLKAAPNRRRPAAGTDSDQLVCRYCGSDDLAPSFRKRRDLRCRACFKQRYGASARKKAGPSAA